ncbi:MAG: PQQ-dependent sugar dehydrogenase [Caulobacter sp.]|nr:PQQ-dependent sugar dehydrogenase [Caulobacter sp.]
MRPATLAIAALVLAACGGPSTVAQPAAGAPLETRPPNADGQTPAFPGQTRAPFKTAGVQFEVETFAEGLDHPWSMAWLPDGRMLVTERPGRLQILDTDGKPTAIVADMPIVDPRGQGGLLDVAVSPTFARDGLVYWSYSEPRDDGNGTVVARGRLVIDGPKPYMADVQVVWRMTPTLDSVQHFGSRLAFSPDGFLFITTGERSIPEGRMQAQDLTSGFGKVIRVFPSGMIPKDNPFSATPTDLKTIWSYGHRNIQAAAINPSTGKLWTVEHGARGGDELNIPQAGKDYGWPTITYGEEYSGKPVGEGITAKAGMEQPVYYWDPVIAPSGMAFYGAALFPAWKGSLFIGGLSSKKLVRLTLDGDRVVGEEWLLQDLGARIRDVRVGPDGAVYVATDDGKILKLVPKM